MFFLPSQQSNVTGSDFDLIFGKVRSEVTTSLFHHHVKVISLRTKEQRWESTPGQCVPFSSVIQSKNLAEVVMAECDEPESECYFKCLNHNKPRVKRTRCLCKEQI